MDAAGFWARVDKSAPGGCWEWTGPTDTRGYGLTKTVDGQRRMIRAYRLAYLLSVGPVPDGLEIDHLCRNRLCCNPAHMEAVTHATNTLRSANPCAHNARKTHCPRGHEYTPDNTYIIPTTGGRSCRECARMRSQEATARKRTGIGKGGRQRLKIHCPKGHEYTPENTRITSKGHRQCRICQNR